MVGMVLAEILQGAKSLEQMEAIRSRLVALPFLETTRSAWLKAAAFSVTLRNEGRTTPLTDLIIAAQALESDHEVFTLDGHFSRVQGLSLHSIGAA